MTRNDESRTAFQKELAALINRTSQENGSDTHDFILAEYLRDCLDIFDKAVQKRETWIGRTPGYKCDPNDGVVPFKPTKNQPYPPAFHVSETARFGNVV